MPDAPPAALRPVPVPSAALLARLAPLTLVPGRPDLVAHDAPDVFALWQAWEEECGHRRRSFSGRPSGRPASCSRVCAGRARLGPRADSPGPGLWERVAGIAALHAGQPRWWPTTSTRWPSPSPRECQGQCGRPHLSGTPLLYGPCPSASPVSSSATSSMSDSGRRPCGRRYARPAGGG